ncbi:hypothetical protein D3C75_606320 [compost metagenome]
MKKLILVPLLALAVAGCGPTPEDIAHAKAVNSAASADPQVMGVLPDGRPIRMVPINNPYASHKHFVYFIDNATVSANNAFQSGKTSVNETLVTLPNGSPEEIIKYAEGLKAKERASDEAELVRLQKKLGQ